MKRKPKRTDQPATLADFRAFGKQQGMRYALAFILFNQAYPHLDKYPFIVDVFDVQLAGIIERLRADGAAPRHIEALVYGFEHGWARLGRIGRDLSKIAVDLTRSKGLLS